MPATLKLSELPKQADTSLKLLWVDRMELAVRGDAPVATLRFYSAFLDHLSEACRLQTSTAHLRAMVDVICNALDYYPSKTKGRGKPKK